MSLINHPASALIGGATGSLTQANAQMAKLANAQLTGVANSTSLAGISTVDSHPHGRVEPGNIIVRKVRNGYTVTLVTAWGRDDQTYVTDDLDKVGELITLAMVNQKIDEAKEPR